VRARRLRCRSTESRCLLKEAATLADRACNAGVANACALLAELYDAGEGVAHDEPMASMLYRKACDGGDVDACLQVRPADSGRLKRRIQFNPGGQPLGLELRLKSPLLDTTSY
jgi:hypothetical protein